MRESISIVKATAFEIISEPLSLLILLAALVLTVLAPAFHYHQFGEATRMARDAGLSSVLMGGLVIAVFGTIRASSAKAALMPLLMRSVARAWAAFSVPQKTAAV